MYPARGPAANRPADGKAYKVVSVLADAPLYEI